MPAALVDLDDEESFMAAFEQMGEANERPTLHAGELTRIAEADGDLPGIHLEISVMSWPMKRTVWASTRSTFGRYAMTSAGM